MSKLKSEMSIEMNQNLTAKYSEPLLAHTNSISFKMTGNKNYRPQ